MTAFFFYSILGYSHYLGVTSVFLFINEVNSADLTAWQEFPPLPTHQLPCPIYIPSKQGLLWQKELLDYKILRDMTPIVFWYSPKAPSTVLSL